MNTQPNVRVTRALVVSALAIGLALGSTGVANAAPEWDIEGYDNCAIGIPGDSPFFWDRMQGCCVGSGGIWVSGNNSAGGKCVAPPVEQSGRNPLPTDAPTHVMQPVPLPVQGGPVISPAPGTIA